MRNKHHQNLLKNVMSLRFVRLFLQKSWLNIIFLVVLVLDLIASSLFWCEVRIVSTIHLTAGNVSNDDFNKIQEAEPAS